MICKACGMEYEGNGPCPACGFQPISGFIGGETPQAKAQIDESAMNHRKKLLGDISIYAVGYIMQEKDGEIVLDSSMRLLLAENLHGCKLNEIEWRPIEYCKEIPNEQMSVDVVIKTPQEERTQTLSAIGPDTSGNWKLGFILKPGMKFAVAVGDSDIYNETEIVSLK